MNDRNSILTIRKRRSGHLRLVPAALLLLYVVGTFANVLADRADHRNHRHGNSHSHNESDGHSHDKGHSHSHNHGKSHEHSHDENHSHSHSGGHGQDTGHSHSHEEGHSHGYDERAGATHVHDACHLAIYHPGTSGGCDHPFHITTAPSCKHTNHHHLSWVYSLSFLSYTVVPFVSETPYAAQAPSGRILNNAPGVLSLRGPPQV